MWSNFDPALLHHPAGMVLFVLAYAIAEVLLLPAAPATILAGSVYGLAAGSALVVLGAFLGAMAVFALTRHWLRPHASRWLERSSRLEALRRVVTQEGLRVLLLARLSSATSRRSPSLLGWSASCPARCCMWAWARPLPVAVPEACA
jgi:uncharacterized membrane protein YdjX (TVP38/TMEM64 family)